MAGGIDAAVIEEVKARVDLVDLISSYGVSVKTAGGSKKACCPFHHEKTPSFNINEAKGFYHCFGCGESGDAIKFVERMDGLSFVDAVKKLAERVGVKIEETHDPAAAKAARLYSLLSELAQFYHRCLLKAKEAELAREYLEKRALGGKVAEDYLIGYAPSGIANILKWAEKYGYTAEELETAGVVKGPSRPGDRGYHRFGGRLMFSIRDRRGRVVGFSGRQLVASKNSGKYVNSPETPVFKKSRILYGLDKAAQAITKSQNGEAIICEGQIDCIRLQTSGFPNSVAGQGTAFTDEHVKMLARFARQVALVYDDDAAGHKATIASARLCLAAGLPVRVVSLPDGDDPDSFLRAHPAADFKKLLDAAESIVSFQIRIGRTAEARPDSVDAVNRVIKETLTTIAKCPDAVLKATMVSEAAKLAGLPAAALNEELSKLKSEPVAVERRVETSGGGSDVPVEGGDAASAIPPPREEVAFAEFLLACEYEPCAKTLAGMVREFLPVGLFAHDFTRSFVGLWLEEIEKGGDLIAPWSKRLNGRERACFAAMLARQGMAMECGLEPEKVLEDFVRTLWMARLKRLRGSLPAVGDEAADMRRMKITLDLKRLNAVKWSTVKEMIRGWIPEIDGFNAKTKGE